jgi:hypothetical protein
MQYLTIIGLSLSTITFAVGLLADITLSKKLFAVKNVLSVMSAPLECLISLLYWGLRTVRFFLPLLVSSPSDNPSQVNPALVMPAWAPPLALPNDASFHLVPSLALILDLLLFSPPYTIAFLPALGLSGVIAFGYWFWIEQCYRQNNFYPYPLFEMLDTTQRAGLFLFSALLMAVGTACLTWLYSAVNGTGDGGALKRTRSGNVKGE